MKVLLDDWTKRNFDPPPAIRTVRQWIKEHKIYPAPIKVGRSYYVDQDAMFRDPSIKPRLADRIPQ